MLIIRMHAHGRCMGDVIESQNVRKCQKDHVWKLSFRYKMIIEFCPKCLSEKMDPCLLLTEVCGHIVKMNCLATCGSQRPSIPHLCLYWLMHQFIFYTVETEDLQEWQCEEARTQVSFTHPSAFLGSNSIHMQSNSRFMYA